MSWSIAGSEICPDTLTESLEKLTDDQILDIYAEILTWKACGGLTDQSASEPFDTDIFNSIRKYYEDDKTECKHGFISSVIDFCRTDYSVTDTGGYSLYVCPYGCHTVKKFYFDPKKSED